MKNIIRNLWRSAVVLMLIMFVLVSFVYAFASDTMYLSSDSYEYIKNNLIEEYIVPEEFNSEIGECAYLNVKNTFLLDYMIAQCEGSLDNYFSLVHDSGSLEGYVLTTETVIPLYDLNPSSVYVVGIIDGNSPEEIVDYIFAENNYEGQAVNEGYIDKNTGLVYVVKDNLYKCQENEILIDYLQVQCLREYRSEGNTIISTVDDVPAEITEDVISPVVEIPVSDQLKKDDIRVYVNDSSVEVSEDCYSLEDGILSVETSSANINRIDVQIKDSLIDKTVSLLDSFLGLTKTYALTESETAITSSLGNWIGNVSVGDYVDFTAKGVNTEKGFARDYIQTVAGSAPNQEVFYDSIITHDGESGQDYVYGTYNGTKKNIYKSTYNATYGINMDTMTVVSSNNDYMKKWISGISGTVQMSCIEVNKAVYQDFGKDSQLHFTALITGKTDNYIAISFCSKEKTSSGSSNQVLCGTYAIKYTPSTVALNYDLNGGSWKTENHVSGEEVIYGNSLTVQTLKIKDEPSKLGYAFMGWSTSPYADTQFIGGESLNTLNLNGDITLYAVWKPASNSLTYWSEYEDSGLYFSDDVTNFDQGKIPVPSHYRYSFLGYYIISGYDGNGNPVLGARITDSSGNLLVSDYECFLQNGQYINKNEINLYALFDEN